MERLRKAILTEYEALSRVQCNHAHCAAKYKAHVHPVSAQLEERKLQIIHGRMAALDWVLDQIYVAGAQ